jgi:hypothetical protein
MSLRRPGTPVLRRRGSVGVRALQQAAGSLRLAGEHHLPGDAGQLAVLLIGGARFGSYKARPISVWPPPVAYVKVTATCTARCRLPCRCTGGLRRPRRLKTSHRPSHARQDIYGQRNLSWLRPAASHQPGWRHQPGGPIGSPSPDFWESAPDF